MLRINNIPSATTVGLLTRPGQGTFSHKHPRTHAILSTLPAYRVHSQSAVAHPTGTTHHGALFELGHPAQQFELPRHPTPKMLRQLREVLYRTRKKTGTIHLFGVIDSHSPLGSYDLLETLLRFLIERERTIAIHAGVWSPTPREFRHAYHNLKSLARRENVTLASVFPTELFHSKKKTEQYLDGLRRNQEEKIAFPLHRPQILSPTTMSEDDVFLILLPPARESQTLQQSIEDIFPLHHLVALPFEYNADQAIQKVLSQSKHLLAVANHASYIDTYFGSELKHPYFESLVVDSPVELLEMLISPHFGYATDPYRTTLLLDERNGEQFDWLLASYIRKQITKPFLFYIVTNDTLHGRRAYSNRLDPNKGQITHQDIHWYGA